MGYRSQVYLKTTTEGWVLLQRVNASIENPDEKPLAWATVERTAADNYKITFEDLKWYDSYPQVRNFMDTLSEMDTQNIPYSFIRIGEDEGDVEHIRNYPDDMPSEIEYFEPIVQVNDEEDYEEVVFHDGVPCEKAGG